MILRILAVLCLATGLKSSDVSLFGVPPSKLLLYQPNKDFTCFDGSLSIPFSSVNDDFCDCTDGSDEPGTSACASAVFYCPNNGYYPLNIPSSRVNDAICDCCDGSDEYLLKNCTDICEALGAQALADAERAADLLNKGNSLRIQMSSGGKQIRQQKQQRLSELTKELNEADRMKKDAEELKNTAESKENAALDIYREQEEKAKVAAAEKEKQAREMEARDLFREIDTDGDGMLVAEEILAKVKTLKSSESKTDESLQDEVKFIMNSKTGFSFDEYYDGTFNHLKSLLAVDTIVPTNLEQPPVEDEQEEAEHKEHDEEDEGENEEVDGEGDDVDEDDKEHEGEVEEQYGPSNADSHTEYDEETKRLIDEANKAREHYDEIERNYKDIERDITALKEFLEKDFGPEDEFLSLEGQCFTYSDREYNYKLCPFDQVVQSGKQGGSETRLGSWKSWESPNNYDTMLYDRGQSCWNGPQRSVKVHLLCGLENEVFNAAEPNKCEYVLDFRTPAACRPISRHTKEFIKDEL